LTDIRQTFYNVNSLSNLFTNVTGDTILKLSKEITSCTQIWICNKHSESCEFEPCSWQGVLDTTLCDKVCLWLATGRWFSRDTPVSSTSKTERQDIAEILLKVALSTITGTDCIGSCKSIYHTIATTTAPIQIL
jgi:hypothetical protein